MNNNENTWYAIRVTYSRELKLRDYLEAEHIKCFLPMRYEIRTIRRKKVRELVPVIHNLIFVYSTRSILDQVKLRIEPIVGMRYIMDKAIKAPIIIPANEMLNFIRVSGTLDEQLRYTPVSEVKLNNNDQVLITGGLFSGVTGCVTGTKKNCRVVVSIPGFMTVVTAHIDRCMLQKISKKTNSENGIT